MFPTATCKVEGLLLVRLISIALFSPRPPDHVVRQSSACSVQSEMSGGGQGSAKIRQGGHRWRGYTGNVTGRGSCWCFRRKPEIPPTLSCPAACSLRQTPPLRQLFGFIKPEVHGHIVTWGWMLALDASQPIVDQLSKLLPKVLDQENSQPREAGSAQQTPEMKISANTKMRKDEKHLPQQALQIPAH